MPQRKMELHQGVCGSSFAFIRGPAKVPYKKSHFAEQLCNENAYPSLIACILVSF